jgi:16S rRNA (guanine(966)-N(2))-methyltransferase RsmD
VNKHPVVRGPRKIHWQIAWRVVLFGMRITGGAAARRILRVPKGMDVRPTPDRVKQAVYNSLGERILGARVLELFAGSGALSLEALSRGCASAMCIEKSPRHAEFIRRNAEAAGYGAAVFQARVQDVFPALQQLVAGPERFDLILADPPYGDKNVGRRSTSLAQKTLDDPNLPPLLAPGGLLIMGHARRDTLEIPAPWHELKVLTHGDNVMRFLQVAS